MTHERKYGDRAAYLARLTCLVPGRRVVRLSYGNCERSLRGKLQGYDRFKQQHSITLLWLRRLPCLQLRAWIAWHWTDIRRGRTRNRTKGEDLGGHQRSRRGCEQELVHLYRARGGPIRGHGDVA